MGNPLAMLAIAALLAVAGCALGEEARLEAARTLQDELRFEESIPSLREVLAEAPDHPEANYRLGLALLRTGRLGPAVWPLHKASESDAYADPAGQLLALALLQSANYDEAAAAADRLLARDASSLAALRLRLQAHSGRRRWQDAVADAERILASAPDDRLTALMGAAALAELGRWDEATQAFAAVQAKADAAEDPALAARACVGLAAVADRQGDPSRAANAYAACRAQYPTDGNVMRRSAEFHVLQRQVEEAVAIWRTAVERAPESLPFRLELGRQLVAAGHVADAETVLTEAAEISASPLAWEALAELHRRNGDPAAAERVLDRALATTDSERLRFKRADLLVDAGDLDAAEAVAEGFAESHLRDFVRGRVLLQRGDPRGALAAFESGLAQWPDNAPARAAAGRAAQEIGDFERALEHYRQAIRADVQGTAAAYAAAHLARALGRPDEAAEYARYHVFTRDELDPDAIEFAVAVMLEAGYTPYVSQLRRLLARGADAKDPRAVAALARLDRLQRGADAALEAIQDAGLDRSDPANADVLRLELDLLVARGETARALARVERALARHPDAVAFLDLHGRLLALSGRGGEARAAFARALALAPEHAPSLAASGALALAAGDLPGALAAFDRAVAADPTDVESAHRAAQIALAQGDPAGAERRLRAVLLRAPALAGAANDLAWLLAEQGRELDFALALAERAMRLAPAPDPRIADTLAAVQLALGDAPAAAATLEAAIAAHPEAGLLHYRLGRAREQAGDAQAALAAYRTALDDAAFTEAEAARAEIARLEAAGSP